MKKILGVGIIAIITAALDLILKFHAAFTWSRVPWFPLAPSAPSALGSGPGDATVRHWLEFTYSQNPGIAFGLPLVGLPLVILNIILILALTLYALHALDFRATSAKLAIGLVLGGALGNLYDRIALGAVRDFLRIGPWPLFNLADTAIVLGIGLLIFHLYTSPHARKKSGKRK